MDRATTRLRVETGTPASRHAGRASAPRPIVLFIALLAGLVLAAGWHLTQGTSGIGIAELLSGDGGILAGARIPRLAAGIAVGFSLGVAGVLLQSIARNALAAPDTLAVTAGSYFAVAAVAAFGLAIPFWASGAVAFVGGLLAAGLVLALAGAGSATTRLILAGSAVGLALQSATAALLILFEEETAGLFAWGSGSLTQISIDAFQRAAPVIAVATIAAVLLSRRLDVLALGDDAAGSLGVPVRSTRIFGVVLAVLLIAVAVTLAGPIGFVGLCAPVIARLLAKRIPALHRHALLIPAAGLVGALVVVGADAVIRAILGADVAILIPTGVATTVVGAIVLVALARRSRDAGPARTPPTARGGVRSRTRVVVVLVAAGVLVAGLLLFGLLAGSRWLLLGDIALWLQGQGATVVQFALDERAPRVLAALIAGAALALAGTLVQASSRNPLAEPGILGITGGAGLGAALVVTAGAVALLIPAAIAGGLAAFALVYGLAWKRGLSADRLILVGIGVWYGSIAITTFILLRSDPWNTPRLFTFLSGSTYGRSWDAVIPLAIALAIALPLALSATRELDLLAVDDDTPRLAGVPLERTRLLVLVGAAVLAALSVSAVGVVGFVGLVAPHAARALVGGRHLRSLPVAVLLGAALLCLADTIGRTVIAPAQLPAGLVVAIIGAPYFVYLLSRSRV